MLKSTDYLLSFASESNGIEGIFDPRNLTVMKEALEFLLPFKELSVKAIEDFVTKIQPDAVLRRTPGQNVRVGTYVAPYGGPFVEAALVQILNKINHHQIHPYHAHLEYENLHPFTDGNGRSGRAIWLWQMTRDYNKYPNWGFLQTFYYHTLHFNSPR